MNEIFKRRVMEFTLLLGIASALLIILLTTWLFRRKDTTTQSKKEGRKYTLETFDCIYSFNFF